MIAEGDSEETRPKGISATTDNIWASRQVKAVTHLRSLLEHRRFSSNVVFFGPKEPELEIFGFILQPG